MKVALVFRSLLAWQSLLWPQSSQLLHLSYTMLTLLPIRQPNAIEDQTSCVTNSIMPLYVSHTLICESSIILYYVKTMKRLYIVVSTLSSKQRFSTGMKIAISMVNIVQTALSSSFTAILYNQRRNFTNYVVRGKNFLLFVFKYFILLILYCL